MYPQQYDIAIVGGGIVGLATALALTEQFPRFSVAIIEKERAVARHQTGHNSGVIHAGIYYKPGSHKARLCSEGGRLLTEFCRNHGVPFERCGKLIVATSAEEVPRLMALHERAIANNIPGIELIGSERAHEIEPHARALRALRSPNTAIVDYVKVAVAMAAEFGRQGGQVLTGERVQRISRADGLFYIESGQTTLRARNLINCAGLYADQVARLMGLNPEVRIVPFRGEYYSLRAGCRLVNGLIYPVPDPEFPFLGVHFTKRIQGDYEAGPNAVLAFAREGYRFSTINCRELFQILAYPGFLAMACRYWKMQVYELYRSLSRAAFLRALQKLVPDIIDSDLAPGGSGVRAQAVTRAGSLVDDFKIIEAPHAIHVLNAPSPAATASLAIGRHIGGLAEHAFDLRN
jgi:L-2-hydroxyglutarate oxidase